MSTTHDIRLVDGLDDHAISAEIYDDIMATEPTFAIKVTANPHWYPSMRTYLTPAAARELAAHLTELADEADLLNLEDGTGTHA